ncbi:hypothetical protein JOC34_003862 [Virgibacillus halotolerans]|nr:hypothetical protein [Virgibacillus halotolerans]
MRKVLKREIRLIIKILVQADFSLTKTLDMKWLKII